MSRTSLTQFDEMPPAMVAYMRHYGPHFNKKLLDFAVSKMTKEGGSLLTRFQKNRYRTSSTGTELF